MVLIYPAIFVSIALIACASGTQTPPPSTTPVMFPDGPPEPDADNT